MSSNPRPVGLDISGELIPVKVAASLLGITEADVRRIHFYGGLRGGITTQGSILFQRADVERVASEIATWRAQGLFRDDR